MRELNKRRENVETICQISSNVPFPSSLHLLPQTSQNRGIQTIIRCKDTSRDEFIFYRYVAHLCGFTVMARSHRITIK